VEALPATLTAEAVDALVPAIERHIERHRLGSFTCSFHGGEPTLFPISRLRSLLKSLDEVGLRTKCDIRYAITTNAALLTPEWIKTFCEFGVSVTVSVDGPPEINDGRRRTTRGTATWRSTVDGYFDLCRAGIAPSIIAVCDPAADPTLIVDHLARDLGARFCDILVPDANHESQPASIAKFYIGLFDYWYDNFADGGVQFRILQDIIRGLLGLESQTESVGLAPTQTVCLNTNGRLEPHDVLRIAGAAQVETGCTIFTHEIGDITSDPKWTTVRDNSVTLCDTCLRCRYKFACGGGHIAQRWSRLRGYDNPSVYCKDFMAIFDHVASRLAQDIVVARNGVPVSRTDLLENLRSGRALT